MRARLFLLLALILPLAAGGSLYAQDNSSVYSVNRSGGSGNGPLQWLFGARRPDARVIQIQPRRAYAPRQRIEPRRRAIPPIRQDATSTPEMFGPALPETLDSAARQTVDSPPVTTEQPAAAPVNVAVVGDSLSIFLAQGLSETYADKPNVQFIRRHREASGLVRDDYYDWPKQLRDLIATSPKLDAILIQIGSNDRQQLRDGEGAYEPRSDRWRDIYLKRIDEIAAIAREKKIPLIWVGLPAMRGERFSADLLAFNDFYKTRASQGGASYIDIWEAFTGDDGAYVVNGPDVDGTIVRLRTADGVHFTKAGARKMAFFADKELRKVISAVSNKAMPAALASAPLPATPGPNLSPLITADLPQPQLPAALKSNDTLLGVPLPDAPLPTGLTPRPSQGPVLSLNAAPLTGGGSLKPTAAIAPTASDVFRAGITSDVKTGRTDDFRLNRN